MRALTLRDPTIVRSSQVSALQAAIMATNPTRYFTCEGGLPFDDLGSVNGDSTSTSGTLTPGGELGEDGRSYLQLGGTGLVRTPYNAASAWDRNVDLSLLVLLKPVALNGGILAQSDGTNRRGELSYQSGTLYITPWDSGGAIYNGAAIGATGAWNMYFFRRSGAGTPRQWYFNNTLTNAGALSDTSAANAVARYDLGGAGYQGSGLQGGFAHHAVWRGVYLSDAQKDSIYNAALSDGWTF